MAMLDLLNNCLSGNTSAKKMFFKVHVLYIDEGCVFNFDDEKREQQKDVIVEACNKYKFNLSVVPLESIFDINIDTINIPADDLESDKYKHSGTNLPSEPPLKPDPAKS